MNRKSLSRRISSRSQILYNEEDFETCLAALIKRYRSSVPVIIIKEYERRVIKSQKKRLIEKTRKLQAPASVATTKDSGPTGSDDDEEITLPITTSYDLQDHLTAILINKFQKETIPRDVIALLALILPNYRNLYKFTIKKCRIDMHALHELGKMLPYTTITDICLDDCPLKQANCEELLQNTTFLKNLSLCRCNINDAVCKRMAATLHYLKPAENSLETLNLSSNRIGDEGAKYFAEALRSNRHLRYLNLAGNLITDEGASQIFNILIEFPLTYDENINRRQRFLEYLKNKIGVNKDCLRFSLPQKSVEKSFSNINVRIRSHDKMNVSYHNIVSPLKRSSSQKKNIKRDIAKSQSLRSILSEVNLPKKAELMSREMIGPFVDPFCPSCVTVGEKPHCIGNFVLCYLNLAYNDLTLMSVSKLLTVVEYQRCHYKPDACGLIKVVLEGNSLPVACTKLTILQEMLKQHMLQLCKASTT
ncbi:hypothetical protein PYW07_003670 [Mythimna separata]|uniref:Leucine-rich repeat-containing protein 71 n=1 Tax=Mythimna separata TaxID=271217 RepID=A0AAD8DTL8_MYTSE|nr:hypothetical protein PYW07_003670 [Mythimna separata]